MKADVPSSKLPSWMYLILVGVLVFLLLSIIYGIGNYLAIQTNVYWLGVPHHSSPTWHHCLFDIVSLTCIRVSILILDWCITQISRR